MTTSVARASRLCILGLVATAALLRAPSASAGDRLAPAFHKSAAAALKDLRATVAAAVKQTKADLKTYAANSQDAATAVGGAVASITLQRDVIEDAALAAAGRIGADGAAQLTAAAVTDPGADFLAGGRGVWDHALRDVESLLDKTDVDLDAAFGKFVKDMKKTARKAGAAIDLRWRLPPHADAFWTSAASPKSKALDVAPAQITIAVRFVETSQTDHLDLGFRWNAGTVNVFGASSATESVLLGSPVVGADGFATASFPLAGVIANTSFLNVQLITDALKGADAHATLSQPRIAAPAANTAKIESDFAKRANHEFGYFSSVAAKAVADLGKSLASHLAAIKRRQATPDLAIVTGFGNLRDTRANILSWNSATTNAPVAQAQSALAAAGVGDGAIPSSLVPDGGGFCTGMDHKWAATMAMRQAAATAMFDGFIGKVEGLAHHQGVVLDVAAVLGRDGPHGIPMVTLALTPTVDPFMDPRFTDVMLVRTNTGTTRLRADMIVQTDPSEVSSSKLSYSDSAQGTILIGGLFPGPGGIENESVPTLPDVPLISHLFRAGKTTNGERTLVVLVTPQIIVPE